jgi:hypothetical protein
MVASGCDNALCTGETEGYIVDNNAEGFKLVNGVYGMTFTAVGVLVKDTDDWALLCLNETNDLT